MSTCDDTLDNSHTPSRPEWLQTQFLKCKTMAEDVYPSALFDAGQLLPKVGLIIYRLSQSC